MKLCAGTIKKLFSGRMLALLSGALVLFAIPQQTSAFWDIFPDMGDMLAWLVQFFLSGVLALFKLFAIAIDYSITEYVVNMKSGIDNIPAIYGTWAVFRDVANIAFIFILLYAGITTILGVSGTNIKRVLASLVIIALLLNFSFFLTGVVVDFANMIALQFYGNIEFVDARTCDDPNDLSTCEPSKTGEEGIGFAFASLLKAQSSKDMADINQDDEKSDLLIFVVGAFSVLLVLVAAFIFATAAMLFIIRYAVLIFLLILSPLAFAARILPGTKKYWDRWIKALLDNAFFAPLYIGITYIALQILSMKSIPSESIVDGIANPQSSMGIIVHYILVVIFMIMSIILAKTSSAQGSSMMFNWGQGLKRWGQSQVVGGARGVGGFAGRNTFGRGARALRKQMEVGAAQSRQFFDEKAQGRGRIARAGLRTIGGTIDKIEKVGIKGTDKVEQSKFGGRVNLEQKEKEKKEYDRRLDRVQREQKQKEDIRRGIQADIAVAAVPGDDIEKLKNTVQSMTAREIKELEEQTLLDKKIAGYLKSDQVKAILENEDLSDTFKDQFKDARKDGLREIADHRPQDIDALNPTEVAKLPKDVLTHMNIAPYHDAGALQKMVDEGVDSQTRQAIRQAIETAVNAGRSTPEQQRAYQWLNGRGSYF